jgi:hypothetical protein
VVGAIQETSLREQTKATEDAIGIKSQLLNILNARHDLGQTAVADGPALEAGGDGEPPEGVGCRPRSRRPPIIAEAFRECRL